MTTTRAPTANDFEPIDPQPDGSPSMPNQTDKRFTAADYESYNFLVGWLCDADLASHALKVGDDAPDFLPPDADGYLHFSKQPHRYGPLVRGPGGRKAQRCG
jgi:hypothetical protein